MKCAIYCRVSTEEQALGGHSIEAQRLELEAYCKSQSLEIYDIYIDAGYSAATMERPALSRMLRDSGRFDIVLVWRLDRITRDMSDLMKILEILQENKTAFKSKTESFDTSTASGKLMLYMLGSFAEFERASISERIKLAHRKILNEGKWRGGAPPFGYRLNCSKTLEIDGDEAEAVRLAFEMSAERNMGARAISVELNRLGYRTRNQKPFSSSYVAKMLKNPTYYGQMISGRQKHVRRDGRKKVEYSGSFTTFKGLFKPIISEEVFKKSLSNMENRKLNRGTSSAVPNPIGGLVYCGTCKDYMLRGIDTSAEKYFVCRRYKNYGECSHHYISESRILDEFRKAAAGLAISPVQADEICARLAGEKRNNADEVKRRMEGLRKQLDSLSSREDILFELVEKRTITGDEFTVRKLKLAEHRQMINGLLGEFEEKLKGLEGQEESLKITAGAFNFNDEFDKLSPADRKRVLNMLVERIEVMDSDRPYARRKVHIYFRI